MGEAMILLTPSAFSFSTSAVIALTSSSMAMLGPGEASSGVSLVMRADDADLLAADIEHDRRLDLAADAPTCRSGGRWRRAPGTCALSRNGTSADLAVVEFVVAERHGVELHLVEELELGLPLVGGVEERALEIVAGAEEQDVLALQLVAFLVERGDEARRAADALALAFFLGRAGRFELVVRFDAAVPVVDMQDVQRVVGKGRRCRHGKRRSRECGERGEFFHA